MQRDPDSHKGDNGRILVIGGCATMHGAPLLAGLAAEASGVDLIHIALPTHHTDVAKSTSLNFQVHSLREREISEADLNPLLEMLALMDCAVIGPGLGRTPEALHVIQELITGAACPLVLDASALQPFTLKCAQGKDAVLTPHLGELERMEIVPEYCGDTANEYAVTILQKGPTDRVFGPDGSMTEIQGGNAGLTVGGTGDVLAGLVCGLRAQDVEAAEACIQASQMIKKTGEELYEKKGYAYTAEDVIRSIML